MPHAISPSGCPPGSCITLSDLEPNAYKTYITASARLYHTPFGAASHDWSYSQLKGHLVFGRDVDRSTQKDDTASTDHGSNDAEKFWFRLVDKASGKTVWMFKVPVGLNYQREKPFFHVFPGKVCILPSTLQTRSQFSRLLQSRSFGFCFDDDDEATEFFNKFNDRASIKCQISLLSCKGSSVDTRSCTGIPRIQNIKDAKKPRTAMSRKNPISTSMISAPTVESFVHEAHVGVDKEGVIEVSGNLDPSWAAVIGELQGYGISQRMVEENLDFVEGFLEGAKSAKNNFKPSRFIREFQSLELAKIAIDHTTCPAATRKRLRRNISAGL